ncbi:glycoside hydrolase family 5 protein [Thermoflexus sp.]|uniref:glycoside hydrolase family 5 protein n=1 Tax=Thermoflexus sp. TaxID=1969742 RepID=UPI0025EA9EB2|nr:glycoside hydrolase family 5 protein [Thermoflexus sp.]MDW8179966.1 glycoside hydrolase family 5 protein [Anaerolineae bacterium]MCS6962525.1 glycoside hydrolase family 5 protein [Thermoflexus sp.]MCS7350515.1 glycoside hydrolase family 5 protein [Thermoflexus sp.]MCX7690312.1 glycoside hydrolase family 5 protein [Thermoflexus sp.]MDW8183636.1 glycoside hydrolase family 5 protein [Anaerolineae bacterium]
MGILLALGPATISRLVSPLPSPSEARRPPGFRVSGRLILDAKGNPFVIRGVNHLHVWHPHQTRAFADIRNAGANAVRVALGSGQRWGPSPATEVADVIRRCKHHHLVCVLQVHDTTGYGEQEGAASLDQAVAYWRSLYPVLTGEEAYVIVNIGNEPHGTRNARNWVQDTIRAVRALRQSGFRHALMVDAPDWGQDRQRIMRDNARRILRADPDRNVIFSVHMYGAYNTATAVQAYIRWFVERDLPLVIGEFGWMHTDGDPNEDAIMAYADQYRIGYLGWSWSGNHESMAYLDMVLMFDPNRLTPWGERLINGPNGLRSSPYSAEASVYRP